MAFGEIAPGIVALWTPSADVPKLHRAAAVLSLRDDALEAAVFQGMVFDFDGKPLRRRIERRDFGHRPGFQDPVKLEPEIVMQSSGVMSLNEEAELLGLARRDFTPRLFGEGKVAFRAISFQPRHLTLRYIRPTSTRMSSTMSTVPSRPDGPYPQPELYPQVGSAPTSKRISTTRRMVPSMVFSLCFFSG